MSTDPTRPSRRQNDGNVVSWSELRLKALRSESAATVRTLKGELKALRSANRIDDDAFHELQSIIEEINADINAADGRKIPGKNAD